MEPPPTLPQRPPGRTDLDFDALRREGIDHIARLAGHLWTDYNASDPGITILEQVCYALTDLAYRISYDIEDLLARDEKDEGSFRSLAPLRSDNEGPFQSLIPLRSDDDDPYRSLYAPATILTTHPVTLFDLRKLLIDLPGVKNAWIEPVAPPVIEGDVPGALPGEDTAPLRLKGLYRVLVGPTHTEVEWLTAAGVAEIDTKVKARLQAHRPLCEDFAEVCVLPFEDVGVEAVLEIGAVEDADALLAEVYHRLARHVSPTVRFYTLSEMLARGRPMETIFDGPPLDYGFIDDDELVLRTRKTALRSSDFIQQIMDVPGVIAVNRFLLRSEDNKAAWYLKLDPNKTPRFVFDQAKKITLVRDRVPVQVDAERVKKKYEALQRSDQPPPLPPDERDVVLRPRRDRHLARYYSIQYQFPATYGIGSAGLPDSASTERKAQARQLQGYLLFFEQILANELAQLAFFKDLFSFYTPHEKSYASQPPVGVPDAEALLQGPPESWAEEIQKLTEDKTTAIARNHRVLNHLMARFAEDISAYALTCFGAPAQKLVDAQLRFLQDYPEISSGRGTGFNYTGKPPHLSGFQRRVCRLLGIEDETSFYVIENILLRPAEGAEVIPVQQGKEDPYSLRLSVVVPKESGRFGEPSFQALFEQTIRQECPAHLQVSIIWMNPDKMLEFSAVYKDWLALFPSDRAAAAKKAEEILRLLGFKRRFTIRV